MKKHIIKKSIVAASMLLMTVAASAQSASSSYFLEGMNQRYQLNPAFAPERPVFMAIPALSNIQVDASSSVGLANFLFESTSKPGMLTTFMSPDIDAKTFLDGMPKAAQFNVGVNMDILALGVGGKNGFTTFNLKLRNNEQINLPKELFGFMKASLAQGDYLIEKNWIRFSVLTFSDFESDVSHIHFLFFGDGKEMGSEVILLQLMDGDIHADELKAFIHEFVFLEETARFSEDEFTDFSDVTTCFGNWDEFSWVDSSKNWVIQTDKGLRCHNPIVVSVPDRLEIHFKVMIFNTSLESGHDIVFPRDEGEVFVTPDLDVVLFHGVHMG